MKTGMPPYPAGTALEKSREETYDKPLHIRERMCGGAVAQRLEQATHNRLVAGSTPAGPIFLCL